MGKYIFLGIILQAAFILVEHKEKYVSAVILKGLASLSFVLLGFNCAGTGAFSNWILAGLIFGMAGDILLNLRYVLKSIGSKVFLVGILIFMIGHIMYLVALLGIAPNPIIPVIIGVILATILLKWIFSKVTAAKAFKIFGVFYIGAVTLMAVTAVWNMILLSGTANLLFAVGGILFLISDVVLIMNTFTGTTKFSLRITNLSLYYLGQLLIAGCMLYL